MAQLRQQTNPRQLRREIYTMIDYVMALPAWDSLPDVRQAVTVLN